MHSIESEADEERRRLRWQCRRGMLELDHLLERFLDLGYCGLDPRGQTLFRALLGEQDQLLSDWLMARAQPPDPAVRELIAHIREVAGEDGNRKGTQDAKEDRDLLGGVASPFE